MVEIQNYINTFPETTQEKLRRDYQIIKSEAIVAEESMSYDMPSLKFKNKPLIYFAGYKNHIGFYATPTGHEAFNDDPFKYKQGKGSVQFPLDEPLPEDLIRRIVAFRLKENNK